MDPSLKFVWAYMIEKGHVTNGEWSYYGSGWEYPEPVAKMTWTRQSKYTEDLRSKIREVGIDWEKTSIPIAEQQSCFNGTFAESDEVEALIGDLVLKNGERYKIGTNSSESRFSSYLQNLQHLFNDTERVKRILGEEV